MYEGLGKHILVYTVAKLKAAGRMASVDAYIASLPLATHSTDYTLMRVKNGLESLSLISALQLPGVLVQASLALVGGNP